MVGSTPMERLFFLAESNKTALDCGDYSDFLISCGGNDFKVHKAIICTKFEVLKKMCQGPFKEGDEGKAMVRTIELNVFEKVLSYLYTGEYDDEPIIDKVKRIESLHINIKLYVAGDYLDIEALKIAAIRKFDERALVTFPLPGFTAAVREALENTPQSDSKLRTRVVKTCLVNIGAVKGEAEKEELTLILHSHEPLAWTLLQQMSLELKAAHQENAHQFEELQQARAAQKVAEQQYKESVD